MKKILIPLTNHATLGETDEANGTFSPELTHALHVFANAGFTYDLASIEGGKAPLYGTDMEDDAINSEILANDDFNAQLNNTKQASEISADHYDAVFYPGGFGLLSDLADNAEFAAISAAVYEKGGIVGAVCHGPAGLLPITLSNGNKLIADKSVTGFTREEEIDYDTINKIPYLLEEKLARTAGRYNKVQPWQEFVVVDERLVTGQNPSSAAAVGEAMVKLLK